MEGAPKMCGWGGNGWMWNGGSWGWGGVVMYIVLAALLVAVVVVVAFAIRDLVRGDSQHKGASSSVATGPEDTLAHRFARGEIDDEEYRRRIAILREHREHV